MTDLTTLSSAKGYLGLGVSTDDAVISSLISAYSEWARSYMNRDIALTSYTRLFSGRNTARLILPQWPIVSITSLTVGVQAITAQSGYGQLGFRFDEDSIVLDGYRFERGDSNIAVAWSAGWATIPYDMAQAINEIVGLRYRMRDKLEWSSKGLAGETVTLITRDMPASVKTVLDQYSARVAV